MIVNMNGAYLSLKGNLAAFWPWIPLMQNFLEKSPADTNSMKTGLKEVTQKLWSTLYTIAYI